MFHLFKNISGWIALKNFTFEPEEQFFSLKDTVNSNPADNSLVFIAKRPLYPFFFNKRRF